MLTQSPATIETALRYICRDDDGRLYAPITSDHARPYVYIPGYSIHAAGHEVHLISVYPNSGEIEVLIDNGSTVSDGPLIDLLRGVIEES